MRKMNKVWFNSLCEEQAYLYIVKLFNEYESFYKIGVTSKKEVSSRFEAIPYDYEILKTYSHPSPSFILDLEAQLLRISNKYKPLKSFGGQTECVQNPEDAIGYITSLSWITELQEYVPSEKEVKCYNDKSVIRLMSEYRELLKESESSEEAKDNLDSFLISNTEFASWLDAGVTLSEMNSCGRTREKIEELVNNKTRLAKATISLVDYLGYKIGEFVSKKELKQRIQEYYDSMGLKLKAKATDIEEYVEVEGTTRLTVEGKRENGLRIVKFK